MVGLVAPQQLAGTKRSFQRADDVSAAKRWKVSTVAVGAAQMAIQGLQPLASAHVGLLGPEASASTRNLRLR